MPKILNILIWGGILLTTIGCSGLLRPVHLTPEDALTGYPGYLTDDSAYISSSVTILQQQPLGDGLVLFYRWQSLESQQIDAYCFATTYVEPKFNLKGKGWVPHMSTLLSTESANHVPGIFGNFKRGGCEIPVDSFVAGHIVRSEKNTVTTAFGFSSNGVAVQIVWSDGRVDKLPLASNGSFFVMRQGILDVQHIDLLDANNRILGRVKT